MSSELTSPALEQAWALFRQRTGFAGQGIGRAHLAWGASRAMERIGLSDLTSYVARLRADPAAMDDFVEEMVIGESYFFREPQQCAFLAGELLPDLSRRRGGQPLRLWSAGCAGGEEAYTLAFLLAEARVAGAQILATDIARTALARARAASYRRWSLREMDPLRVARYFTAEGDTFDVRPLYRAGVNFDVLNLVTDRYPSLSNGIWGLDLILCRNVLLYFDRGTVATVARRLHDSLAPGGWLITGSSDPPLQDTAPFEVVLRPEGVFYRRRGLEPAPALRTTPPPAPIAPSREPLASAPAPEPDPVAAAADHVRALANTDLARATTTCLAAAQRHPLVVELRYLLALLLLAQGRSEEALTEAGRVLYLDRSLLVGHLLAATLAHRLGDLAGAMRGFRTAYRLAGERPEDEPAPLADGATVGALRAAARARLEALAEGDREKGTP